MISGHWHAPGSAARFDAALQVDQDHYQLRVDGRVHETGALSNLKVSERLGNVERKVTLSDGSVFATKDNHQIDRVFAKSGRLNQILHLLESNMTFVLVAVLITALSSVAFFKWGIPAISSGVAHALPHKSNEILSEHTLEFLDDYFFSESELSKDRQQALTEHFFANIKPLSDDPENGDIAEIEFKLLFRNWSIGDEGIPNALALPGGEIILTDRFVELSESQQEIDSVVLHELGHIVHRHTLKTVAESTLVATIVMLVTGDSNGLADMGVGLGSVLVSSNYSRRHESDADLYAFKKMLAVGIDPRAFSRIIDRITKDAESTNSDDEEDKLKDKIDVSKTEITSKKEESGLMDYLSTHPRTADRIALADAYALCFEQGLTECDVKPKKQ